MDYFIICLAAFLASILTFFSGFGLGTILLPVFALFFPVELSVALTGVVHFFNNIFKLILVGRNASKKVLVHFGVPAVLSAIVGAFLLINIAAIKPLHSYAYGSKVFDITAVKLVIAVLLIAFAILELAPFFNSIKFQKKHLPYGGLLSGFFGGLSGHQGALRSAFLINAGLTKESFIGTAVVISCFVDFSRLSVYATRLFDSGLNENTALVISATLSAIAGAFIGNKLLKKITLRFIQKLIAVLLIGIALALGFGVI